MPDLIITNAKIFTANPKQPAATALAIRHNRILAVGSDSQILALRQPHTEWLQLKNSTITPGLVDAHVHFRSFALGLQRINLYGTKSRAETFTRIKNGETKGEWVLGRGWSQSNWTDDPSFPTAQELDTLIPDRPAYFGHHSGHAGWVNTKALHLAGITPDTHSAPGGEIQKDASGKPTGILLEAPAMRLVSDLIPPPSEADTIQAMRHAQTKCWEVGLTGLHDFDGRDCFQALQALHANRELGIRFIKNIPAARIDHAIGVGLRTGFGDDFLRIGGIKIFADGALGPRTALMIAPYENEPDNTGIAVVEKEEMMEIAIKASTNQLSVTTHAIGDKAVHDILDVYEHVRSLETAGAKSLRHRVEHVQLIHPDDQHRLAQHNIIASMQPNHATSDMDKADQYWGDRAQHSYALRTMLDSGATLVLGSDCPVEPIDPLPNIHAAVTRRRPDGSPSANGWYPEQRLTLSETIYGFTKAAAITAGTDTYQGSIQVGNLADLTIFDQDLFALDSHDLLSVNILATIVDGKFRHRQV